MQIICPETQPKESNTWTRLRLQKIPLAIMLLIIWVYFILKQGNKQYALNAFNYAKKNPKDKKLAEESSFQLAKVAYDAGKPDVAIDEFERFLITYPSSGHNVEVKELLAQAYVNGNNFNKAIEYIEALPSRNQYINQAYQKATYLKGSEAFNKGDYEQAVEYFSKSLEFPIDKQYVALASYWSGEAYSIGKRYDQAVTSYSRIIGLSEVDDGDSDFRHDMVLAMRISILRLMIRR